MKRPGWEETKIGKHGKTIVRCQAKIRRSDPAKQCTLPAKHGMVMCSRHNKKTDRSKEIELVRKSMGLYDVGKEKALQKELKEVEQFDDEKLEDTTDELKLAIGVMRKYLKETTDLKIARKPGQLMWMLNNIMNFKKIHWEIKHADKVTYTKEQVDYMFIKIRNILMDVVKDTGLLAEIAKRISKMGIEMREDGFKVV